MASLGSFIFSVASHWIGLLAGCAVTVLLGLLEKYVLKHPISLRVYSVILGSLLFFACYQAWLDQFTSAAGRLKTNLELQQRLSEVGVSPPETKEGSDSLRRRTVRLVDEIEAFRNDRNSHHPPYSNGVSTATGEQTKINAESERYDTGTENLCLVKFESRTRGIVQELKAKGVDLSPGPNSGFFEAMVEQRRCLGEYQYKLFRDLAFHIDGADKLVIF